MYSSTNTCLDQDDGGYFLLKIAFSKDDDCYNFHVPLSALSYSQDKITLPCIKLPLSFESYPMMWFSVYYKEEIILLQLFEYTSDFISFNEYNKSLYPTDSDYALNEQIQVKRSSQSIWISDLILNASFLQFTLQKRIDTECIHSYQVFIFESFEENICDIHQLPLYEWHSTFQNASIILNCSRNCLEKLEECKKYCIYGYFKPIKGCKDQYMKRQITWTFLRVLPKSLNNFRTGIPNQRCKEWDVETHIASASVESLSVTFKPYKFSECFSSYKLILLELRSNVCEPEYGKGISSLVLFYAGKEIRNVFTDIKKGNYCVMIAPCRGKHCCMQWARSTEIINLNGLILEMELPKDQTIPLEVLIAVIILLLISLLALWKCCKQRLKCKVKIYHENEVMQNSQLNTVQSIDLESQSDCTERLSLLPRDIIVYVFHTFEKYTRRKVQLLKEFLTTHALLTVITMDDMLIEIPINPIQWMERILKSKHDLNKRYIFVMSKKSRSIFDNEEAVWNFMADKDFYYALNCVSMDWMWCMNDYSHLFVICFDEYLRYLPIDDKWNNIVPLYRYVIPEDLVALCTALGVANGRDNNQTKNIWLSLENDLCECSNV